MPWSRDTYVTAIREEARAVNSPRWSADAVLRLFGTVHAREWKRLLDVNPDYRTATVSVTADASARVPKDDLTTGAGDAQQRLYKVRGLTSGVRPYQQVQGADYLLATAATTTGAGALGTGLWWEAGGYLQLLPGDALQALTAVVNWTPTRADQLTGGAVAVDWPEDHEMILVYESAALMLARGGDETEPAADLQALAAQLREGMYAEIARVSTRPASFRYPDSAAEWGG
jgi:hypothetical protein